MSKEPSFHRDVALKMSNQIMKAYWGPMWKELEKEPALRETIPAFLVNPEKLAG